MAQSLFEHGQIETTLAKAKDLRPFAERLITLARKARRGSLAARQQLTALLGDRAMIPAESQDQYEEMSNAARARVLRSRSARRHRFGEAKAGQKFTALSIVHHLINEVAADYEDRTGGYTRVIRLGRVHKGDSTPLAVLQLVGEEESPGTVTRPEKTARQRRTERRYRAAAKAVKVNKRGPTTETDADRAPAPPSDTSPDDAADEAAADAGDQADGDTATDESTE